MNRINTSISRFAAGALLFLALLSHTDGVSGRSPPPIPAKDASIATGDFRRDWLWNGSDRATLSTVSGASNAMEPKLVISMDGSTRAAS